MAQLSYEQVIQYESKLEQITVLTYPNFNQLSINPNTIIIAALNPFGYIKYYKISNQNDINLLIRMSENGYCPYIIWYFLKL